MADQPLSGRAMRWAAHARARSEMFREMRFGVDELAKELAADDANEAIDEANDTGLSECPHCGFVGPVEAVRRHRRRAGHEEPPPDADADVGIALTKAAPAKRYVFGVLYKPDTLDAHQEWATADDLQEATWDYFRNGDRKLRKQHDRSKVIGDVVELVAWPYPVEARVTKGASSYTESCPPGTVFMGAVLTPAAWADVQAGRLTGFSMGGTTVRMKEALPS